jgi:hypothetical protein
MKWTHLGLALLGALAAAQSLMQAAGWEPFAIPGVLVVLPLSISLLLRSVSEFNEAETEYLDSKQE